jgi:K+-sensing histidine kinase KdpD
MKGKGKDKNNRKRGSFLDTKNILVCVTQQKTCERLIKQAHELADEYRGRLFVINVVKNDVNFLESARESEALEYLFGISKSIGANLAVLKSDDIAGTIAEYAADNKINCIILGRSPGEDRESGLIRELKILLKNDVELKTLP